MKEDVLGRLRRLLGDDHPDTISASGSLASTLHSLGDYGRARAMKEDVLGRLRRLLGDDHPATLDARFDIAVMDTFRGSLITARSEADDICRHQTRILGARHPDTQRTRELSDYLALRMGGRVKTSAKKPKRKK
ncbi:hypothetical protein GCM10009662_15130 [Catellatospora coxensis]